MKKALLYSGLVLVLLVTAGAAFVASKPTKRSASTEVVERTPERLQRGRYLVQNVVMCLDCHSERKADRYGFPHKDANPGSGGAQCWDESIGLAGFKLCAPNITQDVETGIGSWSDGEIMRAIREGVNKEGKALFPVMPYLSYRTLSDEDTRAIVAYVRTLPAVKNRVPDRILPGPLNIIVRFMPKTVERPVAEPNRQDPVTYGKYLTTIGGCQECHTPVDDKHQPLANMNFAGGQRFQIPGGPSVLSANLTPDASGLGKRTREEFIGLFKSFADFKDVSVPLEQNTVMPWLAVSGMADEDLGAIHAYLQTVSPINNPVERRRPAVIPAVEAHPAAAPEAVAPAAL